MQPATRIPTLAWAVTATLIGAATVSGCTGADPTQGARTAAKDFADHVAGGSLTGAALADDATAAQTAYAALVKPLGSVRPTVTVKQVPTVADDATTASATLSYSWPVVAGKPAWTYDVPLNLTKSGDAWQASYAPGAIFPGLKSGGAITRTRVPAVRGDILGAGGATIVTARDVIRVGVDKAKVDAAGAAKAAAALAKAVGLSKPDAYVQQVAASGAQQFVEAIVVRTDDPILAKARALASTPGVALIADTRPLAPTRTFARPLLGTVGDATAEQVQASGGQVLAGDRVGQSGLQARYDSLLRGTAGVSIAIAGSGEKPLYRVEPTTGANLQLTLDTALQTKAESVLAAVPSASAIVALQPSTGNVLAAASGPGGQGYSTATLGQYAPGSTFKIVTALAALRSGLTPTSPVPCTPSITVNGKSFANYDAYPASGLGTIPFGTAFANSCNTAMISLRDKVSMQSLSDAATSLGLQGGGDLGFAASMGKVKLDTDPVQHAADLIGQGTVVASPLAMASVTASVAAGKRVTPRLVTGDPSAGSATTSTAGAASTSSVATSSASSSTTAPAPAPAQPLDAAHVASLRSMMASVTTAGTGRVLSSLPGPILSKTGTAEFGNQTPPQVHAWMVAARGDLAVAVFVDIGEGGSTTAGPLLASFLR